MRKEKRKFRSYCEYDEKRHTIPCWKAWIVRIFGVPVGNDYGYEFRGRIYVIR
jgi:hypothetical protein